MLFDYINKAIYERQQKRDMVRQSIADFFAEPYRASFGHLPKDSMLNLTWSDLLGFASETTDSVDYNNLSENQVVDFALDKKAKLCCFWSEIPKAEVKRILINHLRNSGMYNPASVISYLRDMDNEWLNICENCGTENLPMWEECKNCEAVNTKI